MSIASEAIQKLLDEAVERQNSIAKSLAAAERTLAKRRAALAKAQAVVHSLKSDLARLSGHPHLTLLRESGS